MGSIEEDFSRIGNLQMEDNREEKILVLVRLRPLSEKEISTNEAVDWECINNTTILYRNTLREGSTYPSAYTFDGVFRGDCSTRKVYDDGVKEVALSAVRGINASIFAYGQTSSGKTYTMMGITEYAISDIFAHMRQHEERAFVLKFSAIEIYNEAIRDLLSADTSPLRLLDDQEKGTIIEKVKEETLKSWDHLQELLSICEAQRRIGETSLNEKSSRSHQILRLTIESSAREFLNKESCATLSATVNFVDLAGSERASQSASSGARLKEGCHINRSLLTLGTVIRKLSKGRSGHVNYRDSKLTRLLQPALGGNARTAIVCTLSPARSHVEQTRNTLLFACCAKEVSTKAQVNVVMSDKALVKHLRREVARLESELRSPAPVQCSSGVNDTIKKKDLQIQKMEKQIRDLTMQRDLAESRVEDLLRIIGGHDRTPSKLEDERELDSRHSNGYCELDSRHSSGYCELDSRHSNGYCKEVQCIEVTPSQDQISSSITFDAARDNSSSAYDVLEERLHHVANALDDLIPPASEWAGESPSYYEAQSERMSRNLSHSSMEEATEIPTVENFVTEMKEMARQVTMGKEEGSAYPFERKRKEIIEKWRKCHVSLVHRTYFFLLFKGEASDSIYMEVELKRLTFVEEQGRDLLGSAKRLKKERKMLSRLMKKRMTDDERNEVYAKWGIGLNTKRRRHQLAGRLWTASDSDHVLHSAALVAKLVNFVDQGRALHGMFGLSFAPLSSSSCRLSYPLL